MTADNGFAIETPDDPNNHTDLYRVYRPEDLKLGGVQIAHSTHETLQEAQDACERANREVWGWPTP